MSETDKNDEAHFKSETPVHKKKWKKNLVVLFLVMGWCALIWLVTMVKIAHGHELKKHDLETSYINQRSTHQEKMDTSFDDMMERGDKFWDKQITNPETWWQGWQQRLVPDDSATVPHDHAEDSGEMDR